MDNEMNVRAPIAPTQGTLIPQSFRQTYQQQNRENARRAASRPNPIFEQFHDHNVTTAGIAENAPIMINALEPEGPAQNGGGGWKTYRYKSEVSLSSNDLYILFQKAVKT
jgi:hypothetical protein